MSNYHDYEYFEYHGKKVEIVSGIHKYGNFLEWTYTIDGIARGRSYSKKNGAKISAMNQILKQETA